MSGNDGEGHGCAEATLLQEVVGAADTAGLDADTDLAGAGLGQRALRRAQRLAGSRQLHHQHPVSHR